MKITVKGIGKIRTAGITIDGISVIAGPNGSGKSTIGRTLMTWFAVLRQLPSRLVIERLKSAREALNSFLKANDLPEVPFVLAPHKDDSIDVLDVETWLNVDTLIELLNRDPEYYFSEKDPREDAEKIVARRDEIVRVLADVSQRSPSYYLPAILEDSFETALDKQFSHRGLAVYDSTVEAEFGEGSVASVDFVNDKVAQWKIVPANQVPLVFYFEPVHLLDLYAHGLMSPGQGSPRLSAKVRYKAADADWRKFLYEEVDKTEWSVERKKEHDQLVASLDELMSVMRGRLEKQGRELRFADKDVSFPISVMNLASGIKTMSAIENGIRAGVIRPGCFLIIDEPESNLHPQWQIALAHFLVKLNAQFDMRLLLNTHSPFFLKAIEVFSREEDCDKRAHYYQMVKDDEGFEYSAVELKDGTNEIFKSYFDAMNDLMSR